MEAEEPTKPPSKGYGQRPVWQWVVLYVIVAAILYTAIYLIFFHHSTAGGSGGYSY